MEWSQRKWKYKVRVKCADSNINVFQRSISKVKTIVMDPGPLVCIGHMGYMWVYLEEVGGERECRKDGFQKEVGVLEEAK